jgi:hypothetical protein
VNWVSFWFLGLVFGAVFAIAVREVQWFFRLKRAIRFVVEQGICRSEDLPVELKYITRSKLFERGWVDSEFGAMRATPKGVEAAK